MDRIQLTAHVPNDIINNQVAMRMAVYLCTAICKYLAAAIQTLKSSFFCIPNFKLFLTEVNVVKGIAKRSEDLDESRKQVDKAVMEYTNCMTDLGVAVGLKHLEQGVKILDQGEKFLGQGIQILGSGKRVEQHLLGITIVKIR